MKLFLCGMVMAMQAAATDPVVEAPEGAAPTLATPDEAADDGASGWRVALVAILGGAAALGGAAYYVRGHGRRLRTCPRCRGHMVVLDEVADDAHLEPGQRVEERVGAVDYRVRRCESCGEVRTTRRSRWFSGRTACPRCRHRTLAETTTEVVPATYDHRGLVRVVRECAHCQYWHASNHATPQMQGSLRQHAPFPR